MMAESYTHEYYTHTTWYVKPELEAEFAARWSEWVEWSHLQGLAAPGLLLRDLDSPHAFVSFGPWEDLDAIKSWRSLAGYQERVARLREVVERFEPRTLEVVTRSLAAPGAGSG
jgi:heme-degrading monooxygenase HmoA